MSGIVALATVLIVPGSAFLVGSVTPSGPANIERALGQIALLAIVMYYAFVGCLFDLCLVGDEAGLQRI